MLSRTRTVNGSAVSSMERMVDVISSGSRGPTRSRTSRASDFIATSGGRGKIARSMRAMDAAQFPALDATTPYIAGPMMPGNSSNVSGNENSLRNAPSSSSHLYVCKPIFASDSCARPHVKSIHPGSYASCKLRFGRDASQGATPATTAGCVRELHGFTSTPRRRSASQSDDDDGDDDDDAAVVNIRSRMLSIAVRMDDDRDAAADDDASSAAPRRLIIIAGIPLAVAPFAPTAPREPAHDVAHDALAPHVGARATSSRAKRRCMEMIDCDRRASACNDLATLRDGETRRREGRRRAGAGAGTTAMMMTAVDVARARGVWRARAARRRRSGDAMMRVRVRAQSADDADDAADGETIARVRPFALFARVGADERACEPCAGLGRVRCGRCLGRGRTNAGASDALPRGEWPRWCLDCRGSGRANCAECLGSGRYRAPIGFRLDMIGDDGLTPPLER